MSMEQIVPKVIMASILYEGFSTFVYNAATTRFVSFNKWEDNNNFILNDKMEHED